MSKFIIDVHEREYLDRLGMENGPFSKLEESYELLEEVGYTRTGFVALAKHRVPKPDGAELQVIVKIFVKTHQNSKVVEESEKCYKDELKANYEVSILLCQHYWPAILDSFSDDKYSYLIFEYFQGYDSLLRIMTHKPPTQDVRRRIIYNLINAVQVLHNNNIAHRDLSPENILVNAAGDVKLIDFDSARKYENRGVKFATPCSAGKPSYRSPEAEGLVHLYSPFENDMWVLGHVIAVIITGRPIYKKINDSHYNDVISGRFTRGMLNYLTGGPEIVLSLQHHHYADFTTLDIHFLDNLLCSASRRFTIEQVMRHDFHKYLPH